MVPAAEIRHQILHIFVMHLRFRSANVCTRHLHRNGNFSGNGVGDDAKAAAVLEEGEAGGGSEGGCGGEGGTAPRHHYIFVMSAGRLGGAGVELRCWRAISSSSRELYSSLYRLYDTYLSRPAGGPDMTKLCMVKPRTFRGFRLSTVMPYISLTQYIQELK